jgi:hypothetical protein
MGLLKKIGSGIKAISPVSYAYDLGKKGLESFSGKKAKDYAKQGLEAFQGVTPPSIEEMQVKLQQLVQQGQITPDEANNAFAKMQTDPQYRAAANESLKGLQDVYKQGGLTAQDKAQLAQIQRTGLEQERGTREALAANAAARGTGGSGMNYAAQLANQQGSATRQSTQGLDVAAQAQQRALNAMIQSGQLGMGLESQQFGEEAQKAQAANAINQFNVNQRNAAQYYNLGEKQRVSDTNAAIGNQQEQYNKGLYQQNFQNQMAKAGGIAGQYANLGNLAANQNKMNLDFMGNIIGTGGKMIAAGAGGGGAPAPAYKGGKVIGKARIPGDHPLNDKISARLSPGEIVIPRTMAENPMKAASFAAHMAEGPIVHSHDLEGMLSALSRLRARHEMGVA